MGSEGDMAATAATGSTKRLRVAVIGSGIAGLSAAWLLSREHDVVIYEKSERLGMDQHGIDVPMKDGSTARIDVPLRVFTEAYYPNLTSLYHEIGIEYQAENYCGSFSSVSGESFFSYKNLILGKFSLPYIMRLPFNWTFFRILGDLMRFFYRTPSHFGTLDPELTLIDYLNGEGYSEEFINKMMIPSLCGICTCSYDAIKAYPAHIVVDYMVTRSWRGVRRVVGGALNVVTRLSEQCHEVRCGTTVSAIRCDKDSGKVTVCEEGSDEEAVYDHVVVSTQANHAIKLVEGVGDPELTAVLSKFPYESSALCLHTDWRLMPAARSDWQSVNFVLADDDSAAMASIWMNQVQPVIGTSMNVFQTWNPLLQPHPDTVICSAVFERPVVNCETVKALDDIVALQGRNNIWLCGSYAELGVPLLETAVQSAVNVSSSLGVACPWAEKVQAEVETRRRRIKAMRSRSPWHIFIAAGTIIAGGAYALRKYIVDIA